MDITIRWLLEQNPSMTGFSCLAGDRGIDRRITGINIMDNPDTVPWLKQDELILSTGYIFSSTNIYKTIVQDLYNQGCSGLGIKMNRYMDSLPDEMLKQANNLGFTIFSIPFSSTMEQIVNIVYRQMFQSEMSESIRMMNFYRKITEASLKRHSTLSLLKSISDEISAPVFLCGQGFELIEYYIPKESETVFPFSYCKNSNIILPEKDIRRIIPSENAEVLPVIKHSVKASGKEYSFVIFPVINRHELLGYLACLEENKPFSAFEYSLISNINSLIYISMINDKIIYDTQQSGRTSFFNNLLSGSIKTETEIESLCRQYGFDFSSPRLFAVIKPETYAELSVAKQRIAARKILSAVQEEISGTDMDFTYCMYDNNFVLALFLEKIPSGKRTFHVSSLINDILKSLGRKGISCFAGMGCCRRGASTISKSYTEGLRALELGKRLHPEDTLFSYEKDMIYHIYSSNLSVESLTDIYSAVLKPLDDYDRQNDASLSETLYEYIKNGQNISQTAAKLYIHRNTMLYRLQQIKQIINFDLKSTDSLYIIQTAFYIKQLLKV